MTVRTRSLASAQATRNATAEVADAVAAQTEKAHQDPLWSAVMAGDEGKLLPLLRANPALLAERGPVGETPFLMLVLYGKVQLAKRVAGLYPEVVDGRYEGGEYHGENALHIAVVQKRIDVARWLVRAEPELLQHRADGAFFAVGQPCNYGQVPLLFAAGTNQPEMFDMLVAEGADPNAVDSFGNNALHVCVEHDLPEMYVHVCRSWARDAGVDLAKTSTSPRRPSPTAATRCGSARTETASRLSCWRRATGTARCSKPSSSSRRRFSGRMAPSVASSCR